jgi:hypothetical protein
VACETTAMFWNDCGNISKSVTKVSQSLIQPRKVFWASPARASMGLRPAKRGDLARKEVEVQCIELLGNDRKYVA